MNIDLLAKMVKEMILDSDSVTLPGLGTFVAEVVPASFSDKGYTIHPPYRRLFFRQHEEEDSQLVDFYCRSNGVEHAEAVRILGEFLSGLKSVLLEKKTITLPGLGRLRATKENNFFFVPDEDLDIYPEGFGLEPLSLKTHEETQEEVSAAIAGLKAIIVDEPAAPQEAEPADQAATEELAEQAATEQPVPEQSATEQPAAEETEQPSVEQAEPEGETNAPEVIDIALDEEVFAPVAPETPSEVPAPEAPAAEPATEPSVAEVPVAEAPVAEAPVAAPAVASVAETPVPAAAVTRRSGWRVVLWVLLGLVGMAALLLAAFFLLCHVAPDFIDSLLYSSEELRIINY